ncbi:growth factor receptor-bound protein 14 isoform X2 [Hyla sarda]|uniref:growth factor receptor-bound protein 14 isoform X2 n=1 Tax=Hyla sarda TaxID=327740 RepID=UPI0024C3214C|nr:growth factor receptor-bound protein 14 isoform X2 [Hyla sarda]
MSLYTRRVTLPAITPLVLQKRVIKVFSEDGTSRALEVPNDTTAVNVCQLLIQKNHYIDDQNWTMFEQLPALCLERIIEDHELVIDVQSMWDMEEDCRFCFRKYYAKYEFFKTPEDYFPDFMLSYNEVNGAANSSDTLKMFLSTNTYPEVHSYLYVSEKGKKSWKKLFFVLRRSGLYFSTKGTSKDPRHLQFFSDLSQSNIYMLLSARKMYGAPTDYGFCLKQGHQIYQNYLRPQQKNDLNGLNLSAMRSISENSLVAVDFSGHKTRVIENPTEALSIALQEGLLWRRKSCGRISTHGGSPTSSQNAKLNIAVHMSQPWFHHNISRDEAQKLIHQQGLVNGVFLVRDSQSTPKSFVLSLCYGQKIKHFQILPTEGGGELFYSLDEGHTRFTDLTQLVEFHQLNRGILPCTLKHYCTRVTF